MILNCPECSTKFLVNEAVLEPHGRKVKCAACKHVWFQEPARQDGEALSRHDVLDDIPDAVKPIAEGSNLPVPTQVKSFSIGHALFGMFILLATIGVLMVSFRHTLVETWEPADIIFAGAGLSVPVVGTGLSLDELKVAEVTDATGQTALRLSAFIKNDTGDVWDVPALKVTVKNSQEVIAELSHEPEFNVLMPRQSNRIQVMMPISQSGAEAVQVRFEKRAGLHVASSDTVAVE